MFVTRPALEYNRQDAHNAASRGRTSHPEITLIALQIEDLRLCTSHLFVKESFDYFLLTEASITTFATVTLDGRQHSEYYTEDERTSLRDETFVSWAQARPLCFSLIKGKRLPLSFRIVLKLSADNVGRLMESLSTSIQPQMVSGLFLNIRYEHGKLTFVTGTSLSTFTPDKSVEQAWDEAVKKILKHHGIAFS